MSRYEYRYYVTLLPCNQFVGGGAGGELSQGGVPPGHPLLCNSAGLDNELVWDYYKALIYLRIDWVSECLKFTRRIDVIITNAKSVAPGK